LISKLKGLKVKVPEALKVGGIIAKLPSSWNDYKKKLLYTTKEFYLKHIKKHSWIEEETIIHIKRFTIESVTKVNYI